MPPLQNKGEYEQYLLSDDLAQVCSNVHLERTVLNAFLSYGNQHLNFLKNSDLGLPPSSIFADPQNSLMYELMLEFMETDSFKNHSNEINPATFEQFVFDNPKKNLKSFQGVDYSISIPFIMKICNAESRQLLEVEIVHMITDLSNLAFRREMYAELIRLTDTVVCPNDFTNDQLICNCYETLNELSKQAPSYKKLSDQSALPVFLRTLQRIQNNLASGEEPVRLKFGIDNLDNIVSGIRPGTLNVLGGRPGTGKTTLGFNLLLNVLNDSKRRALLFSMEMNEDEITQRMMSSMMQVPMDQVQEGKAGTPKFLNLLHKLKTMDKQYFLINDTELSPSSLDGYLERYKNANMSPDLVVIDYFQLMSLKTNGPCAVEHHEHKALAKELRAIAQKYNLAILVLSQVGRSPDGKDTMPRMEQIKGGVSLSEVADLVILLHSEEGNQSPDLINVSVAKNRNGPEGRTEINFTRNVFTFS